MYNLLNGFLQKQELILREFKIKHRLLITFLVISIVPLTIVGIFSFYNSYQDVKQKEINYSKQITSQVSLNTDSFLNNIKNITDSIINSNVMQKEFQDVDSMGTVKKYNLSDEINSLFNSFMYRDNSIDGIQIMRVNGSYQMFSGDPMVSSNYKNTYLFRSTVYSNSNTFWWAPHINEIKGFFQTRKKVVTYSTMVPNYWSGEESGVLAISFLPSAFDDLFRNIKVGNSGNLVILDPQGTFIYEKNKNVFGEKVVDENLIHKIYNPGIKIDHSFNYSMNGKKYLVTVNFLKSNQWVIVRMISYHSLLSKTNHVLYFTITMILLLVFLSIFISIIVSRSISKPLQSLIQITKDVEKGQYDINVDESGKDEIFLLNRQYKSMVNEINFLINQLYKTNLITKEVQYKALKAQINPHFLYNTLETMSSIANVKNIPSISKIANSLASMFRYSINEDQEFVHLREELNNIKEYISILKIRYQDNIIFEEDIEESLYDLKILKFILQPIFENAVKHGVQLKKGIGRLKIKAKLVNGKLNISVSDNGLGIEPDKLKRLKSLLSSHEQKQQINDIGIGLFYIKERLAFYYKDAYHIDVNSIKNVGTVVHISIPIE